VGYAPRRITDIRICRERRVTAVCGSFTSLRSIF
jgi:hypothetical protein